jgi:hypothetical protein
VLVSYGPSSVNYVIFALCTMWSRFYTCKCKQVMWTPPWKHEREISLLDKAT